MQKIVKQNIIKNSKNIPLNINSNHTGVTKYFPSFAKEWKNIIYSYNSNIVKNIPMNYFTINKIIKNYFNLYFNNWEFINDKYNIYLKKRRRFLKKILVSNAEIKYTNTKAIITLYIINIEKKILEKKYKVLNRIIRKKLIKRFIKIYKNLPSKLNYLITKRLKNKYTFINNIVRKDNIISDKFNYLNQISRLNYFYIKKIWASIEKKYLEKRKIVNNNKNIFSTRLINRNLDKSHSNIKRYILLLRRYQLLYTLNQYKFSRSNCLVILSNLLSKITGKKIEYNIINLKSLTHNSDIFTYFLSLKIKKKKSADVLRNMSSILNIPNLIKNKNILDTNYKLSSYLDKYKDMKILTNLFNDNKKEVINIDTLLKDAYTSDNNLYTTIYDNIKYKNIGGIKLEVSGRLTKRYRADRAKSHTKIRGGFREKDSLLTTYLFRGNTKSNTSYSLQPSKRRIGSFAVKGWISGI